MSDKYYLSTPIGVHRLLKKPYDDTEVFESPNELIDYCRNGACYNGQIVKCKVGTARSFNSSSTSEGYYEDFVINNNYPIIQSVDIGSLATDDNYILIYNHNPNISSFDISRQWDYSIENLNFYDPFAFSILEFLEFFRASKNSSFNFRVVVRDPAANNSISTEWTQLNNPVPTENVQGSRDENNAYELIYYTGTEGIFEGVCDMYTDSSIDNNDNIEQINYYLFPTFSVSNSNKIISLYVKAESYLLAAGHYKIPTS